MFRLSRLVVVSGCFALVAAVTGCGGNAAPTPAVSSSSSEQPAADSNSAEPLPPPKDSANESESPGKRKFTAVALGGDVNSSADSASGTKPPQLSEREQVKQVMAALKPMQILLGQWRGSTNRKFNGFSAVEELEWVWDFRKDHRQPALVVSSPKGPYLREGRLTYLTDSQEFQFTFKDPEDVSHTLIGTFEREPADIPGDDNKPQRTYKLVLSENGESEGDAWQIAFNQQENNRYLVEVSQRRGAGKFQRLDTVGTQRQGTSIAASDEDYGERTCIISGGLGTISVSYEGKSYWVCCTGCAAAFNEDPKRWLAKLAAEKKE